MLARPMTSSNPDRAKLAASTRDGLDRAKPMPREARSSFQSLSQCTAVASKSLHGLRSMMTHRSLGP